MLINKDICYTPLNDMEWQVLGPERLEDINLHIQLSSAFVEIFGDLVWEHDWPS